MTIKTLQALFYLARPLNCLMAGCAVALGFWLSHSPLTISGLLMLVAATIFATAFGNTVNDIHDVATDRISHPDRPLVTNQISLNTAKIFGLLLALAAIGCGWWVSTFHAVGAFIPVVLLLIYALVLKATPIAGNIVVAGLVAYPLIFGALGSPDILRLVIPAVLAFLLNFGREIIKDLQDADGDRHAGIRTTALLPPLVVRATITFSSLLYLGCLFLPVVFGRFGIVYEFVCILAVLPLHISRLVLFFRNSEKPGLGRISLLYKVEMLAGLVAISADEFLRIFIPAW